MKSKIKLTAVLLLLSTLLVNAASGDYSRQIRKSWVKSSISSLKITNKFGEVKLNDNGGDSVTLKVIITIDNQSSAKAQELLDQIHIDIQKAGNKLIAETTIDSKFNNRGTFSINYLISIPKDRELDITNRYGNIVLNDLEAKGAFNLSYGSMSAGKLKAPAGIPIDLMINYGKLNLESVNDAVLEFNYSKLYADEIGKLVLESKYSSFSVGKMGNLNMISKYDAVNFENLEHIKSESKYTNYKIGILTGSLDLDNGYGSVQISKVGSKFDRIYITNSYGGISLGMNELNFRIQADCDYCDVKYPIERFKGNKVKENHRFSLEGQIGNGGGTVSITSRYGGIKLTE